MKVLEANEEGLSEVEQENLASIMNMDMNMNMGKVNRNLSWKIPEVKVLNDARIVKKGKNYELGSLKNLTDPAVLYRLPGGQVFP